MDPKLLLISTSTVHGKGYLEYCQDHVMEFFAGRKNLLFIPYARPGGRTHDQYTEVAAGKFRSMGFEMTGIHEHADPFKAVMETEGIFIGGGNTFVLLNGLYEQGLLKPIRERVMSGIPYMGTSAGSNVAGLTISTTNDMPIAYPPSFAALNLVPFNLNPHYLDPDPNSKHMGETRETRIKEFHVFNQQAVVGIREGSWLDVEGRQVTLGGDLPARLFRAGQDPEEYPAGSDLSFLCA